MCVGSNYWWQCAILMTVAIEDRWNAETVLRTPPAVPLLDRVRQWMTSLSPSGARTEERALTHSLTHTHTHTHSLTHSLTHTHTHAHTLTHTLAHSLTHSLTHAHTHSLTHSLTRAHTHAHTHSLTHSLTHSRGCSSHPLHFMQPGTHYRYWLLPDLNVSCPPQPIRFLSNPL